MSKRNNITVCFLSACTILSAVGCTSEIVEKRPNTVAVQANLSEIAENKSTIDEKLNRVEEATKKIRRLNSLLRRAYRPDDHEPSSYTPVDFMIDASEEFQGVLPKSNNGDYVREAVVELNIDGLADDCKTVETRLESATPDALLSELQNAGLQDRKVLKYSAKACGTDGKFAPIAEVSWEENQLLFNVNSDSLSKIFNVSGTKSLNASNWNCKVTNEKSGIIESVYCSNVVVNLSKTEDAIVDRLAFNNRGDTRFEANARILEGENVKAIATILVNSDGDVDYHVNRVEKSN